MITDAFDNSEVLFGTKDFYGEQKHLCDKCMVVFSEQIFEYMLDTYEHQEVGVIRCCNGITPVYVFDIEGMKIAGYLSHIGSALAGGDVIDVNWLTGAVKFVMFGSAGSLDSGLTTGCDTDTQLSGRGTKLSLCASGRLHRGEKCENSQSNI